MTATAAILRRHGIDPTATLGAGMEATVYARDARTVLKLYHSPDVLPNLRTLQQFYDALDAFHLPYALPRIISVEDDGEIVATVERRLDGTPMAHRVPDYLPSRLDDLIGRYLDATLALRTVHAPLGRCKLFDPMGISVDADWHTFLRRYVEQASARLAPFFERDVRDWQRKRAVLEARLAHSYTGTVALIHGDIFPGNFLMVDDRITALLDFGMMTMFGDPLWDVATGCAFFDMYDSLGLHVRDRCLAMARERLGAAVQPRLLLYILLFSVVGADAYDPTCTDGHYRWCVANLNNAAWWREV